MVFLGSIIQASFSGRWNVYVRGTLRHQCDSEAQARRQLEAYAQWVF